MADRVRFLFYEGPAGMAAAAVELLGSITIRDRGDEPATAPAIAESPAVRALPAPRRPRKAANGKAAVVAGLPRGETRREILEWLRGHGPASPREIADGTGKTTSAIYNQMPKLVGGGRRRHARRQAIRRA
jgi:hypothetical protein